MILKKDFSFFLLASVMRSTSILLTEDSCDVNMYESMSQEPSSDINIALEVALSDGVCTYNVVITFTSPTNVKKRSWAATPPRAIPER